MDKNLNETWKLSDLLKRQACKKIFLNFIFILIDGFLVHKIKTIL